MARQIEQDESDCFDAVVIGGGSAGLAFAKRAAGHGARVALIEMEDLGGTCVNRGCVPKKLMWHVARAWREEDALSESGHLVSPPLLDFAHVQKRVANHVEGLRDSFDDALDEAGVRLLRGQARLSGPGLVSLDGRELSAEHVVIATGSVPVRPDDLPGGELCDVSDDVFGWRELPERIVIAGGGYIGVEFATVFAGLGTNVTLVETGDEILEGFDSDGIGLVRTHLEQDDVDVRTGAELTAVERRDNMLCAILEDGNEIVCDRVLYAVGREPRLGTLGEAAEALQRAESGALRVSERFETSVPGIYAVGDAADRMPLTPVARRDAKWLADHLFGDEAGERLDLDLVATVVFADPPLAQVGRVDPEDGLVVEADQVAPLKDGLLATAGEEKTAGRATFFHKIVSEGEDGPLRGAVLLSRSAPDEIAWVAAMVAGGVTRDVLSRPASIHPSFAEEIVG